MKNLLAAALLTAVAFSAFAADEPPQEGKPAPAFTLPSESGKAVSLADFKGKWVVLYFYPKDFTKGCTIEAHNFQQDIKEYEKRDAAIVGVSVQSAGSHKDFCAKEGLDFKLLADTDYKVSKLYGSLADYHLMKLSARNTFLIDPKGVLRKRFMKVNPSKHSAEVLAALDALRKPEAAR